MPTQNEIRSTFLDYFAQHGHEVVASSPLVPRNDPSLMFTNSGMVQFKNLFTGAERRPYTRATSSQKCVRAGGKHNDLDNVGYTARHHTFFEMLGNFSFGDYFKEEAIPLAWNLLTKGFGLSPERMLVTVYHTDEEAVKIWRKVGVKDDRIIKIATSDNFWQMGPTGPCGPCTEIFYDHGDHIPGGPPGSPDEDGDRFIEIWNIVFMQNEQAADGSMTALEMQSIDTGMGLERISALLQGSHDNYNTDTLRALIEASAAATNSDPDGPDSVHHRVISDHIRAISFLMADGVMPSNVGRGYVLRRIMRRAMRHGHLLGARDPLLNRLVPVLVRKMGAAYPELVAGEAMIEQTLFSEEVRFRKMLERGLTLLEEEVAALSPDAPLPGETAFKLYDTYGFPLDLTQDALREKGLGVDTGGFDAAMAAQKEKARAAWAGSGETENTAIWYELAETHGATEFLGYDTHCAEGVILAMVKDGTAQERAERDQSLVVIFNQTPFYGESGGQVGDSGTFETPTGKVRVIDTKKSNGLMLHVVEVTEGHVTVGQGATLQVDEIRRNAIRANHSATHLLHAALQTFLGAQVAQRGSLNAPDRLRFDFSYTEGLTQEELTNVERQVNAIIRQNTPVETRIMHPDDAREIGAQALFGEKYGDEVRVVSMGEADTGKGVDGKTYSLELCGGTHVRQTGDIGAFVTLAQSASSAGVRRIEALTGEAAMAHLRAQNTLLSDAARLLKTGTAQVPAQVKSVLEERKALSQQVENLRRELALAGSGGGGGATDETIDGVTYRHQLLPGTTGKDLPALIDRMKAELSSAVILLIADPGEGKVAVAIGVTDDLTVRLNAVDLARAAVASLGGKGGGGRPSLAQGGARDAKQAQAAFEAVRDLIAAAAGA